MEDNRRRRAAAGQSKSLPPGMKKHDPDKVFTLSPAPLSPAPSSAAAAEPEPTAKAIVAKGRTVHVPTGAKKEVGTVALASAAHPSAVTSFAVMTSVCVAKGPGEEVELSLSDIKRLTALGFLVDPETVPPAQPAAA